MPRKHKHPIERSRPAFFSERLVAFMIDALLFYGLFLLTLRLVYAGTPVFYNEAGRSWLAVWAALFILYHAEAGAAGRPTLGKWLMGLRVVDSKGHPLPFHLSLLRSAGYLLSSILNLGFLWALFHPKGKTWHDLLSGSRVVTVEERPYAAVLAGSTACLLFLAGTFLWQAFGAPHFYRVQTLTYARMSLKSIGTLEDIYRARHGHYTENVDQLARLTTDPDMFYRAIATSFVPEKGVRIRVNTGEDRYTITAFALDTMRTQLRVQGPRKG